MREKLNRCMAWVLGKQENSVNKSSPSANEEINPSWYIIKLKGRHHRDYNGYKMFHQALQI